MTDSDEYVAAGLVETPKPLAQRAPEREREVRANALPAIVHVLNVHDYVMDRNGYCIPVLGSVHGNAEAEARAGGWKPRGRSVVVEPKPIDSGKPKALKRPSARYLKP